MRKCFVVSAALLLSACQSVPVSVDQRAMPAPASATATLSAFASVVPPDFPSSFLENLPPPMEAPPNVHLPIVLVDSRQWQGSQCGITVTDQRAFRNPTSWKEFWEKAIAPYDRHFAKLPGIDFGK